MKTAGLTIVKMLMTGLVMVLLTGAFVKLKLFGRAQYLTEILDRPVWDDVIIRPDAPRRGLFVSCPALTPLRLPLCTFQKSTI